MLALIASALGLATEVAKGLNDKRLTAHADRMAELEKLIREEKALGQLSDDWKIEAWEIEFSNELTAFYRQFALLGVAK